MKSNFLAKSLLLTLLSLGAFFSNLEAQTATVYPQEHPEAITNPGIGYRGFFTGTGTVGAKVDYSTLAKHYVSWGSCETSPTEDIKGVVDRGNTDWINAPANNYKITPRIFLHYWPEIDGVPAYLKPWDYRSESARATVLRIIRKIGKAWDKDPRIQSVETGILGAWGEQQQYISPTDPNTSINAVRVAPDGARWQKIMADAFKEAFPNKPLLVREMNNYARYGNDSPFSGYWDVFASPGQYKSTFQVLQDFGDRPNLMVNNNTPPKRYLIGPIIGEIDWSVYGSSDPASPKNDPQLRIGTSGGELIGNDAYSTRFANYVRTTHASVINGMGVEGIDPKNPNLQKILKAFGYRFHITELTCSKRVEPGSTLTMSAKIKNLGSAPIYQNYPVAFVLLKNQGDSTFAFKSIINDIDIRKWHPGSNFDWEPKTNPTGTQVYLNPAVDNLISASITIPATLAKGDYFAGIAILEPSTGKPAVYFAIPNFFKASQAQPLCRIGVGQDPVNTSLTGVTFDVMNKANDSRNYDPAYYKGLPEVKLEVFTTPTTTGSSTETSEPSGKVKFKFTRQASDPSYPLKTVNPLKVTFEVGGTATVATDYTLPASVVIPAGASSVTMDLNVSNDNIKEADETVVVNLTSNQLDYYLTNSKQATVTIKDDGDFDMTTLGNIELLGSWVQGKSISRQTCSNRALVVLITGRHEKADGDSTTQHLKVNSVTYGGQTMKLVKGNYFRQGPIASPAPYTYSGAFVLEDAGIVAGGSDNNIVVTWQTPNGALEPKDGSNIMSALFSNVSQTVLKGDLNVMNPLSNGQASSSSVYQFLFDVSSTTVVEEFKNKEGDAIILAGGINRNDDGVYRIDSGFTSFGEKLADGAYRVGDSGSFYGFKVGTGAAERPTFHTNYFSRKSMVGFVLKKIGYNFDGWTGVYGITAANAKPTDDFDNDGMPNLMEYALGLNPSVGNSNPLTPETVEISGKRYLSLSVNRDPNALATVTIRGATTGELTGGLWSSASTVEIENSPTRYVVRDTVAIGDVSKRFIRLEFLPK